MNRNEPRKDIVKQTSGPILIASTGLSVLLVMGVFYANPYLERTRQYAVKKAETVEMVEIPVTTQQKAQVAPTRPQVPVEAEDEAEVEDVTIEDTELFDEAEVPVPEKLEEEEVVVEEEEAMEFWMVEEQPKLVKEAMPVYPEIARQAGMDGDVWLVMVVGKTGRVEKVDVVKGPPVFHAAAKATALLWVFTPAKQNDRPVRVKVTRKVSFRLN
jgi:periplasmic protein TonB